MDCWKLHSRPASTGGSDSGGGMLPPLRKVRRAGRTWGIEDGFRISFALPELLATALGCGGLLEVGHQLEPVAVAVVVVCCCRTLRKVWRAGRTRGIGDSFRISFDFDYSSVKQTKQSFHIRSRISLIFFGKFMH